MEAFLECTQVELPFGDEFVRDLLLQQLVVPKHKRKAVAKPTRESIASLNLELPLLHHTVWDVRSSSDTPTEVPKTDDLSVIPEEKFGELQIGSVARLATGFFYDHLRTLLNERGNVDVKREILNWIYADAWVLQDGSTEPKTIGKMEKVPFTCQFCCWCEEINYETLCEVLAYMIDVVQDIDKQNKAREIEEGIQTDLFLAKSRIENFERAPSAAHIH